jgi:predicted DNA-binding transcriptional regulator YafY
MDLFHRYFTLHQVLSARRLPVSRRELETRLECSRATVKRLIEGLRGYDIPICYDRQRNGYLLDRSLAYELPGIWFNASELYALLAAQQLLEKAEPGLLAETLAPLKRKIEKILAADHLGAGELAKRVRILRMAGRGPGRHFQRVTGALIERRRLRIRYLARTSGETSEREISPQRLTHYRDNWYLDAWCHLRQALRSFALERIAHAERLAARADRISERDLDRHFASAYGIFAGEPKEVAVLRFSPERARWVSEEVWHPRQQGRFLSDGTYELRLPYGDPRELLMDILRHGAEVEVAAPEALRRAVADELGRAASRYR